MRAAAALLAFPLLLISGAAALADDGRPSRTVERATELPPRRDTPRELVIVVGGLGSSATDATWDSVLALYRDDPRIEVRRFGADPRYPYDTTGDLDVNGLRLRDEIRSVTSRYTAIHLITHSMGGAVADRAFAQGLSDADGIRTYIALAAPHNGATAARIAQGTLAIAGDEALELRAATAALLHDPATPAVRDLASRPVAPSIAGFHRLDLRMATDLLVAGRDTRITGGESRTLLPSSFATIEGHGGILRDPAAMNIIGRTIAGGAPPPDDRGVLLREATDLASRTADELAALLLMAAAAAAIALAHVLRMARLPRLFTRPAAERALGR